MDQPVGIAFEEKRVFLRHPVKLLVEIKSSQNFSRSSFVTETIDLSQGGLSFLADWQLPMGQIIDVSFLFGQHCLTVKARVCYSEKKSQTWRCNTGAAFLDSSGDFYVKLAGQFIGLVQREGGKKGYQGRYQIYEVPQANGWLMKLLAFLRVFRRVG